MNQETANTILHNNLQSLSKATAWLQQSYDWCKAIKHKNSYSDEELNYFEALSSRFARTVDILINKAFRSIDKRELEDGGTVIDILNRADKRGIIVNIKQFKDIKALRNSIAHEYSEDDLEQLFKDILLYAPTLLTTIENCQKYCREKFNIDLE